MARVEDNRCLYCNLRPIMEGRGFCERCEILMDREGASAERSTLIEDNGGAWWLDLLSDETRQRLKEHYEQVVAKIQI